MKRHMPIPDVILNAPVLFDGLSIYLVAYGDLISCRGVTIGGVTQIPWTAINDWCIANELDESQRDDMFYFIRALDQAAIQHINKKPS